jgi:hypothetical protein
MNRSHGTVKQTARRLMLYINGLMLVQVMILLMESTERPALHGSWAYIVMSALPPIVLGLAGRASGIRFAATIVASFYTLFIAGLVWILPLFPAEPKLGPVYQHVTSFIPPEFPMLFIVPALALDLWWQRTQRWNAWRVAATSALLWVALLVAVEWPFASFLMSPAARNRFFGAMYFFYGLPPTSFAARYLFYPGEGALSLWGGFLLAVAIGTVAFRWGIARGEWLRKIQR